MMTTEHRKPFAAFLVVFAVACLIMVNGLQTQVVRVFVGGQAPQQATGAPAPDLLLGQSLRRAPGSPQPDEIAVRAGRVVGLPDRSVRAADQAADQVANHVLDGASASGVAAVAVGGDSESDPWSGGGQGSGGVASSAAAPAPATELLQPTVPASNPTPAQGAKPSSPPAVSPETAKPGRGQQGIEGHLGGPVHQAVGRVVRAAWSLTAARRTPQPRQEDNRPPHTRHAYSRHHDAPVSRSEAAGAGSGSGVDRGRHQTRAPGDDTSPERSSSRASGRASRHASGDSPGSSSGHSRERGSRGGHTGPRN
jgi:hypothetical protein